MSSLVSGRSFLLQSCSWNKRFGKWPYRLSYNFASEVKQKALALAIRT